MKKRNAGLGLALALMLTMGASAQITLNWTNTAGGSFNDSLNWTPNTDPATADRLYINGKIVSGDIILNASLTTITNFQMYGVTTLTMDLNGYTFADAATGVNNWTLGNSAGSVVTATFQSSQPGGVLQMFHMRVGPGATDTMDVTFTGTNLTVNNVGTTGDLDLLHYYAGRMVFSDGVTFNSSRAAQIFRGGTSANRLFLVTDPGTTFNMNGAQLHIGKGAQGMPTMVISNGAKYVGSAVTTTYIGNGEDAGTGSPDISARLIVTGAGSAANMVNLLMGDTAGNASKTSGGYLYIADGGSLVSTGYVRMGYGRGTAATNNNAYGNIVVSNLNSRLEVRGNYLQIGTDGYGDVVVADNAKLTVTNHASAYVWVADRSTLTVSDALVETKTLYLKTNATVNIELGARDHAEAYIKLSGKLSLDDNVTLGLSAAGDFVNGSFGEEITLFTLGGYMGSAGAFANIADGAVINVGGYDFEYQEWGDRIVLTAIPEPGTLGLIGAGLGLAALIRRRRG